MVFYFVDNTERTNDIEYNSLSLNLNIQRRGNKASFRVISGQKPAEYQDVKIYDGALVQSHIGAVITLKDRYQKGFNLFRVGQDIFIDIGGNNEKKVRISAIDEDANTLTLTADPGFVLSENDKVGELIFGGVVARVADSNIYSPNQIEHEVTVAGYEKIFDKKNINDSWQNADCRYIINAFVADTVNYSVTLDNLSYSSGLSIAAEYNEFGDGNNPSIDNADYMEGDSSGVFSWTYSGGSASWAGSPSARDLSFWVGASSGTPTEGELVLWLKTTNYSDISSLAVRVGSSSTDYAELTFEFKNTTDWQYLRAFFDDATVTGSPDWTAVDYIEFIVNETTSGSIILNGLRVNQKNSFSLFNVSSTIEFRELKAAQKKPTEFINELAKAIEFVWYIDYERDIHFIDSESQACFYSVTESSENWNDLKTEIDLSQLGNRIVVRGAEVPSDSFYSEVFEGDGVRREWLAKSKFSSLSLLVDDGSSTDTMEATTTTTTVIATAHGLAVGDHVVMRSRNNVVRRVLTVPDPNSFTVEEVTGQTAGDIFSFFSVVVTDGVEGLTDETTVDYVGNSNEKSIRATSQTATLNVGEFLRLEYKERLRIQPRYTDAASANKLRNMGLGDGIFDLDPISDSNITDIQTALVLAEAKVKEFSNPVITGSFSTNYKGFKCGDILQVNQPSRGISDYFLIQKISAKLAGGEASDHFNYSIGFGTTLFGVIEFYQKLLKIKDAIEINSDDIVIQYVDSAEEIGFADTNQVGPTNLASSSEEVEFTDSNNAVTYDQPWQWEGSTGQPLPTRWNLFQWG